MPGKEGQASALKATLLQRCPACGKGKLLSGLTVRDACSHCGLSFAGHEKGDGPAFFAIVAVGFIVTALAGYVEINYEPPYWVHAVLWLPLIIILSIYLLRVFKAFIIAAQYHNLGLNEER